MRVTCVYHLNLLRSGPSPLQHDYLENRKAAHQQLPKPCQASTDYARSFCQRQRKGEGTLQHSPDGTAKSPRRILVRGQAIIAAC